MRVIIRVSLNADPGSTLRNDLAGILAGAGFTKPSTATWTAKIGEVALATCLQSVWSAIGSHLGSAHLDHFWMCCHQDDYSGSEVLAAEPLASEDDLPRELPVVRAGHRR